MDEATSDTANPARRQRDQIALEHKNLRELCDRIESTADLAEIVPQLNALRTLLREHFATEEAPDGFYETVQRTAPHFSARLSRLLDEHKELLVDLDRVAGQAILCLEGPVADVRRQAAELSRRLKAHEQDECDLLSDSIYSDIGGGD